MTTKRSLDNDQCCQNRSSRRIDYSYLGRSNDMKSITRHVSDISLMLHIIFSSCFIFVIAERKTMTKALKCGYLLRYKRKSTILNIGHHHHHHHHHIHLLPISRLLSAESHFFLSLPFFVIGWDDNAVCWMSVSLPAAAFISYATYSPTDSPINPSRRYLQLTQTFAHLAKGQRHSQLSAIPTYRLG